MAKRVTPPPEASMSDGKVTWSDIVSNETIERVTGMSMAELARLAKHDPIDPFLDAEASEHWRRFRAESPLPDRQPTITFDRHTFAIHVDKVIEATLIALGAEMSDELDRTVHVAAKVPARELRRRIDEELAR